MLPRSIGETHGGRITRFHALDLDTSPDLRSGVDGGIQDQLLHTGVGESEERELLGSCLQHRPITTAKIHEPKHLSALFQDRSIQAKLLKLSSAPGFDQFATHAIAIGGFALQNEDPRSLLGHCLGESSTSETATDCDDIVIVRRHGRNPYIWNR